MNHVSLENPVANFYIENKALPLYILERDYGFQKGRFNNLRRGSMIVNTNQKNKDGYWVEVVAKYQDDHDFINRLIDMKKISKITCRF